MPQSFQEEFVQALMERSMGSPFIFEPDDYRIGGRDQHPREAADLAWVSRDTAILMYMRSSAKDSPEKADAHNFGNARRWLRHWQQGRVMKGRNGFQEFDVSTAEIENLVVLSVVKVGAGSHTWVRRVTSTWIPGAEIQASVPESVLQLLAESGGSAADLGEWLAQVAKRDQPLSESLAQELLVKQRHIGLQRGWQHPDVRRDRDPALDQEIASTLIAGLRQLPKAAVTLPTPVITPSHLAVFNDLDWACSTNLLARTADAIRLVRDVPVGQVGLRAAAAEIEEGPYLFVVLASDDRQAEEAFEKVWSALTNQQLARRSYPPILLMYILIGRPQGVIVPVIVPQPQTGRTVIARHLRGIAVS